MTKRSLFLYSAFSLLSLSALFLATYLVFTRTSLNPRVSISACGLAVTTYIRSSFSLSDNIFSSFILVTASVAFLLTLIHTLSFIHSHHALSHQTIRSKHLPQKLKKIVYKNNLQSIKIVLNSSNKSTAYTIGLFSPTIVISRSLLLQLSSKQLEAVILHEFHHAKSHHLFWLFITRVFSRLLFFIPLISHLANQLAIQFELSADMYAVSKQKSNNFLCSSLAHNLQPINSNIPGIASSPLEKRINFLLTRELPQDKIPSWKLFTSLISFSVMLCLLLFTPKATYSATPIPNSQVCQEASGCVNLGGCQNLSGAAVLKFSPLIPASFSYN